MTDLLEQHLAPTFNPLDDSDWLAVVRRAGRPRRRRIVLVAAAASIVVLAAVPFGVAGRLVNLIQGTPAPQEIQTYFAASNELRERLFAEAPAATQTMRERYSPVLAGEARGVAAIESPDGPIYLWVAPTENGGQCWLIQTGGDPSTGRPYGEGGCDDGQSTAGLATGAGWTAERPSVLILHARVYDASITEVDAELADGGQVSLPVASGHALGTVAKDEHVEAYVGRNADGDEVERVDLR